VAQRANRGVNTKKRRTVFERYCRRCAACGKRLQFSQMQCDHILAKSERGSDNISNLQSLCENCHKFKHGWSGCISYWRLLKCGCKFSVIRRKILPTRRVIRHLKIKPPVLPPLRQLAICCARHSQLPDAAWCRLGPIRYHPKFVALSLARFQRFCFPAAPRRVSEVLRRMVGKMKTTASEVRPSLPPRSSSTCSI
jgi:5-methylcytosine-specific restriction enzyme A